MWQLLSLAMQEKRLQLGAAAQDNVFWKHDGHVKRFSLECSLS